ncbi:PQQ-dependent sugar dehydrogenase [Pararhizobium sp. BT-229]|uniref:PQQ-dependent sugar dehydrogenase n=1 Tax=Pararhizobium sp. BT-229 TaxID=2986923 RepID=UPI0021F7666D|nr:PQQ-dependent sugar dehydrogenase [Pararhizobium sp. BT-229]MCV9962257.1 PQQ-dependent sugar dehydrogenase [Pararhizobium sp. BT-229]
MRSRLFLLTATILSFALAGPALSQSATGGAPVENRRPNGADQKPAFEGQTRAAQPAAMPKITTEIVAEDLPHLWAMEFLPDGRILVTAKEGSMHIVSANGGEASAAIEGVPEVDASGQGGLLDVALAPDFETSGMIFFSFSEPRDGGNGTSVASAKLVQTEDGGGALEGTKVIFQQMPTYDGDKHYGSRLVFGPNDELYVTVGERSDRKTRVEAQDVSSGLGKVFRIDREGKALPDNPLVDRKGARPEIWSYGHRNLQSAALDGDGRLWTVEHGPKGGDELNRPQAGLNYGWPKVTYGIEYSGGKVGDGITALEGTEQPVYYWDPVIGPSGMAFYEGDAIPEWKGAFLIGGLVAQGVVVLHMDGDKVKFEEHVPVETRIRDVKVAPDGSVYALTESRRGGSTILRLTKA